MDPTPPAAQRHIQARDLGVAEAALQGLYGDVRARCDGPFEWRARVTPLGPIAFIQGAWDAGMRLDGAPRSHVLTVPVRHAARATSERDSAEIAPGCGAALFSPGARVGLRTGEMQVITLRFDPGFLAAQLEALTGVPARTPVDFALSLPTGAGAGAYVERLCHFIAGEVDRGTPIDHPVVMTDLVESLARALLTGQPHDHDDLLERPPPPSGRTVVRLVEEYLDAHAGEPIGMADLTALTGADARSIGAAFRQHCATTPAAFLRGRRLERARGLLLSDPLVPVLQVAHASGFQRVESFEAAYVAAFGERPEDTRRRGFCAASAPPAAAPPGALAARLALLSPREREVCVRVARGLINKQIGAELGITEPTVKAHRGRAMAKLGAATAAELGRLFG
jgi:DNA-binding CsgD family transcriptional regulator